LFGVGTKNKSVNIAVKQETVLPFAGFKESDWFHPQFRPPMQSFTKTIVLEKNESLIMLLKLEWYLQVLSKCLNSSTFFKELFGVDVQN